MKLKAENAAKMVLDLDLFRSDKGHDPNKVRENQKLRFKDVQLVETVIEKDTEWRSCRHRADNWNKLKNVCSKEIGEKMKKKEDPGSDADPVPTEIVDKLVETTSESLKPLKVNQIKKVRALIDEAIAKNEENLAAAESVRNNALREIGMCTIT